MPFDLPTRLGNYELLALLGTGGMGEVYRARDVRLPRFVAIKVLRADLAAIAELRSRFEVEARAVSSLNHPNICTFHDIGRDEGVDYLVMEFLEGDTLERRLRQAPLSVEQSILYAVQIADALDQAHRRGVVHRDLKPGNIMLAGSRVKVMDFGLAKVVAPPAAVALYEGGAGPLMTRRGTILGTPSYMAPEQLRGTEADARTDIFALGAIIYEMVLGRRAFDGATEADVSAAILSSEVPGLAAQSGAPLALEHVVQRCLAKDPNERWQTARDLLLELEWIGETASAASIPSSLEPRTHRLHWAVAAAIGTALVCLSVVYFRPAPEPPGRPVRFAVLPPADTALEDSAPALSADGAQLVFVAAQMDQPRLWIRPINSLVARALPGTEGASNPFWSPDGAKIAFFSNGKLKSFDLLGGVAQTLCDAPQGRGGSWSSQGVILFSPRVTDGLYRVPATGGEATRVTTLDPARSENSHRWPHFLPDGRHFLYFIRSGKPETRGVFSSTLDTSPDSRERRRLLGVDSNAAFVDDGATGGQLLFVQERMLRSQPFDWRTLTIKGDASTVAENVSGLKNDAAASFAVAGSHALAYADLPAPDSELVWFDRSGKRIAEMRERGAIAQTITLSRDEKQAAIVALDSQKGTTDIWLVEFVHGFRTRFTTGFSSDMYPVWSPDGGQIIFSSSRDGVYNPYRKSSAGTGPEELLYKSDESKWTNDWSRDGRFIIYVVESQKTKRDLWVLPLFGERKPFLFVGTDFIEQNAQFSPDGRWVAYGSNESGKFEVYVQSFPKPSGKRRVSRDGGDRPLWRADGKELFYVATEGELMATPVDTGHGFESGAATGILGNVKLDQRSRTAPTNYAAAANGQRFLAAMPLRRPGAVPIAVVLDWSTPRRTALR